MVLKDYFIKECKKIYLFEKIRRIRVCGLVGGNVPLGSVFEVSKVHSKTSVSLYANFL